MCQRCGITGPIMGGNSGGGTSNGSVPVHGWLTSITEGSVTFILKDGTSSVVSWDDLPDDEVFGSDIGLFGNVEGTFAQRGDVTEGKWYLSIGTGAIAGADGVAAFIADGLAEIHLPGIAAATPGDGGDEVFTAPSQPSAGPVFDLLDGFGLELGELDQLTWSPTGTVHMASPARASDDAFAYIARASIDIDDLGDRSRRLIGFRVQGDIGANTVGFVTVVENDASFYGGFAWYDGEKHDDGLSFGIEHRALATISTGGEPHAIGFDNYTVPGDVTNLSVQVIIIPADVDTAGVLLADLVLTPLWETLATAAYRTVQQSQWDRLGLEPPSSRDLALDALVAKLADATSALAAALPAPSVILWSNNGLNPSPGDVLYQMWYTPGTASNPGSNIPADFTRLGEYIWGEEWASEGQLDAHVFVMDPPFEDESWDHLFPHYYAKIDRDGDTFQNISLPGGTMLALGCAGAGQTSKQSAWVGYNRASWFTDVTADSAPALWFEPLVITGNKVVLVQEFTELLAGAGDSLEEALRIVDSLKPGVALKVVQGVVTFNEANNVFLMVNGDGTVTVVDPSGQAPGTIFVDRANGLEYTIDFEGGFDTADAPTASLYVTLNGPGQLWYSFGGTTFWLNEPAQAGPPFDAQTGTVPTVLKTAMMVVGANPTGFNDGAPQLEGEVPGEILPFSSKGVAFPIPASATVAAGEIVGVSYISDDLVVGNKLTRVSVIISSGTDPVLAMAIIAENGTTIGTATLDATGDSLQMEIELADPRLIMRPSQFDVQIAIFGPAGGTFEVTDLVFSTTSEFAPSSEWLPQSGPNFIPVKTNGREIDAGEGLYDVGVDAGLTFSANDVGGSSYNMPGSVLQATTGLKAGKFGGATFDVFTDYMVNDATMVAVGVRVKVRLPQYLFGLVALEDDGGNLMNGNGWQASGPTNPVPIPALNGVAHVGVAGTSEIVLQFAEPIPLDQNHVYARVAVIWNTQADEPTDPALFHVDTIELVCYSLPDILAAAEMASSSPWLPSQPEIWSEAPESRDDALNLLAAAVWGPGTIATASPVGGESGNAEVSIPEGTTLMVIDSSGASGECLVLFDWFSDAAYDGKTLTIARVDIGGSGSMSIYDDAGFGLAALGSTTPAVQLAEQQSVQILNVDGELLPFKSAAPW